MIRYLSGRAVARALSMPWADVEPLLEQQGADIIRIGKRIRVDEAAVEKLIANSRQQPLAVVKNRADVVLALALERMAQRRKRKALS